MQIFQFYFHFFFQIFFPFIVMIYIVYINHQLYSTNTQACFYTFLMALNQFQMNIVRWFDIIYYPIFQNFAFEDRES